MASVAKVRALKIATVVLLLLAALRMVTLVLHSPVLAYANQYDMLRSSACVDLWPGPAAANLSDAQLEVATPKAPIAVYQRRVFDRNNCYWSTDVVLTASALALHQAAIGGNDVDIRWIGAFKTTLLLAGVLTISGLLWPHPRAALLNAMIAALILADPLVMLYANTLYTEFGGVLGLYLTIAGALVWQRNAAAANVQRQRLALAIVGIGLSSLACARVAHAPLAIILGGVLLYFAWRGRRNARVALPLDQRAKPKYPLALTLAVLLPLILGTAVAARNQHALAGVSHANASNTLFFTVLPSAPDPVAFAQALGLPAQCGKLAFSSWYLRRATDIAHDCPEAFSFSRARLAMVLATHPRTAFRVLANALAQSRGWRMRYIGEQAGGEFQRAPFWTIGELAPKLPYPAYVWLTFFALSCALLACGTRRVKTTTDIADFAAVRLSLALLIAALIMPLLISLLGDGYTELPRHAHLSLLALLAILLILAVRLKAIGIRRLLIASVASAVLSFILFAQPAAIAAWDHPLKAQAGERVKISGWALDTFGLVGVYATSPRQAEQPLEFSHRAGIESVFQGYPNTENAGVSGQIVVQPPYTEIRVRNRFGVETVVDRIWTTEPSKALTKSPQNSSSAPSIEP